MKIGKLSINYYEVKKWNDEVLCKICFISGAKMYTAKLGSFALRAITFSIDGVYILAGSDDSTTQVKHLHRFKHFFIV